MRTEGGKILIRTRNFRVDGNIGRSLLTAEVEKNGDLTGEVVVEIFPPDAGPLDLSPATTPINTFGPTDFTRRTSTFGEHRIVGVGKSAVLLTPAIPTPVAGAIPCGG